MKIRTDLTAFSLTGLVVVAIVALTIAGRDVPELLTTVALVTLGVSGGAAVPTTLGGRTTAPAPAPEPVAQVLDVPEPAPTGPAAVRAFVAANVPAPAPAPVPGRDMTETFPAITAEQIAAHRAGRA